MNVAAVWDADTGERVHQFRGARWAAFAPDGDSVAVADGPVVRVLAVPTWAVKCELKGHTETVTVGAFSPDGGRLVTGSHDRTVRVWDLASGTPAGGPWSRLTPVRRLAFTADGAAIVEGRGTMAVTTDPASGALLGEIDVPAANWSCPATGPDTRRVAVNGPNGEAIVWDLARRRPVRVFRGHAIHVSALAFSPDGRRLASGGADQVVRVWDLTREADVRTLAETGEFSGSLALSPDGTRVAVGPRFLGPPGQDVVRVYDTAAGRELRQVRACGDVAFHPDSRRLATGRVGAEVVVWDTDTGAELWSRIAPGTVKRNVIYAPDGRRVAFSPDGTRLATWNVRGGGVQLWGAADGSGPDVLDTGDEFLYGLAFSPDGNRLVVAGSQSVSVWDIPSRTRLPWPATGGAFAVAFNPGGGLLATSDRDRVVRVREAASGKVVQSLAGNTLRVNCLAFHPDGTRLVTGGSDRSVRIWDVESGQELLSLPGVSAQVVGVAWDRAGEQIIALDDSIRVCRPGGN
jgi:WD40 repeat protein